MTRTAQVTSIAIRDPDRRHLVQPGLSRARGRRHMSPRARRLPGSGTGGAILAVMLGCFDRLRAWMRSRSFSWWCNRGSASSRCRASIRAMIAVMMAIKLQTSYSIPLGASDTACVFLLRGRRPAGYHTRHILRRGIIPFVLIQLSRLESSGRAGACDLACRQALWRGDVPTSFRGARKAARPCRAVGGRRRMRAATN